MWKTFEADALATATATGEMGTMMALTPIPITPMMARLSKSAAARPVAVVSSVQSDSTQYQKIDQLTNSIIGRGFHAPDMANASGSTHSKRRDDC
jgi:hypothetical protein